MRGSCTPRPTKALARPLRTPRGNALARYPNPETYGNEDRYGKVKGSTGEGRHDICGMLGDLARRHDEGPTVEGDLRQEHGVA